MLIRENQAVCVEDLNIKGMMASCKPKQDENGKFLPNGQAAKSGLSKSISDVGWGMFGTMLEYKALWSGKNILRIGRFEASSKTCSCCGVIKHDLTLADRVFSCNACGLKIDRDLNAAINIKNFALSKLKLSVERRLKNRSELPTLVGVMTCEALGVVHLRHTFLLLLNLHRIVRIMPPHRRRLRILTSLNPFGYLINNSHVSVFLMYAIAVSGITSSVAVTFYGSNFFTPLDDDAAVRYTTF